MDLCVDKLVNDIGSFKKFRDEMNEKKENIEIQTKNSAPMKNKDVIKSLLGMSQQETINVKPPKQVNNKGGRKKKRIQGHNEKVKKDGRTCHGCGKFIKFGSIIKHDARNCHKCQSDEE